MVLASFTFSPSKFTEWVADESTAPDNLVSRSIWDCVRLASKFAELLIQVLRTDLSGYGFAAPYWLVAGGGNHETNRAAKSLELCGLFGWWRGRVWQHEAT